MKNLLVISLIAVCLFFCVSLASSGTDTGVIEIIPINMGYVNNAAGVNSTIQNNPSLYYVLFSSSELPFFEFNLSSMPFNTSITNVSLRLWVTHNTIGGNTSIGIYAFKRSTTTGCAPINQTSTADLYNAIWNGRKTASIWNSMLNDYNRSSFNWTNSYPSSYEGWDPELAANTIDGLWFNDDYAGGTRSIKTIIQNNITNYTEWNTSCMLGMYQTLTNSSFATPLNLSVPAPRLIINFSYNPHEMNSSYPPNKTQFPASTTSVTLKFNLSEAWGNRTHYQVWLYNVSTGSWEVLQNWTRQPAGPANGWYGNTSYNHSGSITLGGLVQGNYKWKVVLPGNTTTVVQEFLIGSYYDSTTRIQLPPINEGYVEYNSGTTAFSKFTPWADAVNDLLTYNNAGATNSRIFFEWNLSHHLPVDAYVSMVNLTYNATELTNPTNVEGVWVLITNLDGNTTNQSSGASIWNNITNGASMHNSLVLNTFFVSSPGEWINRSTLGTPIDANHEGYWYYDGVADARIRNIRNATMDNLSTSYDRMIMGYYIPTGAASASGAMVSSINTSCTRTPILYINFSYNKSISNGCNFTNNSELPFKPTVHFFANNSMGIPITYYVMVRDVTSGTPWVEERLVRRATNGTQSIRLYNASSIGHVYEWFYIVVNGTTTPSAIYRFTVETPPVAPPSNIVVIDISTTTLNFTFTPFSYGGGYSHTVCYYAEGTSAPGYGSGTLGFNTTGTGVNIGGLTRGTTYTFSLWTYWNDTENVTWTGLSSWYENVTNTTSYGEVVVCLRYENISTAGAYNELVNLSNRSVAAGEHMFIIHYANASSSIYNFTAYTYNTSGYTPNQTILLTHTPLFYEFIWNYSTLDATNFTSQYTRLLTPYAETVNTTGEALLTFYLTTNKHVYNQYYTSTEPTTGVTNYTLESDINNLVDYCYQFEDLSGYFNPSNSYNTIASVFTYVGTSKIIIDQRYVDAAAKINPTLNYHSYYYVGLNSTTLTSINDYYQNLGLIPTERVTSPYVETITIYSLSADSLNLLSNISYSTQWMSNGFYFNYTDDSLSTSRITITIFNVTNNTFQYLETQWANGTSNYNFQYITTNPWHDNISYRVYLNFTYTFDSGVSQTFTLPGGTLIFKPSGYNIVTNTTINGIFTLIFGASPFYHPETNYFIQYADIIVMFIGIFFLLSFTGVGNAVLGIASQGIFYLLMKFIISGISVYFAALGAFLIIIAVMYAIRNSGGSRE